MKLNFRQLIATCLLIIMLSCILVLCGCTSTKHIDTTSSNVERTQLVNVDSIVKIKIDSVKRTYEEILRTLDADIIFDSNCDTAYIDTGSTRVVNTIEYIAGKGFKATGNIKSFKLKEAELIKQIEEISIQLESEINLRIKTEDALKVELSTKKVDKKTKVFNLWWLIIVGYILGWQFPPSKWLPKVKSLFTKIKKK